MSVLMWIGAVLAATVHVLIFALESVGFRRPAVHRRFGVRGDLPESTRLFAFNQGFYNLFLAVGMGLGLVMLKVDQNVGLALIAWNALSMLGASLVLLVSSRRLWRGTVIQGGPALLTLLATAIVWLGR